MKELQYNKGEVDSLWETDTLAKKKNAADMWSEACITCPTCVHSFFVGGVTVLILTPLKTSSEQDFPS